MAIGQMDVERGEESASGFEHGGKKMLCSSILPEIRSSHETSRALPSGHPWRTFLRAFRESRFADKGFYAPAIGNLILEESRVRLCCSHKGAFLQNCKLSQGN